MKHAREIHANSIQIRDFRDTDFEELWAIDQACFDRDLAYSRAELRFYIRLPGSFTLVAEDEVGIIGFLVGRTMRNATGHIITIDVLRERRRLGAGSLLLSAAEARIHLSGCTRVTLETAVNNVDAIAFYHRREYTIVRTLRGYYSNGLNALVMQKQLQ